MDRTNEYIVVENCERNDAGELTDENKMKAWVEHCARLLNVDFDWPSNKLSEVPPIGLSIDQVQSIYSVSPIYRGWWDPSNGTAI